GAGGRKAVEVRVLFWAPFFAIVAASSPKIFKDVPFVLHFVLWSSALFRPLYAHGWRPVL
ncbi:MAG TPA: hypothetical protein PKA59_10315, partial [Chakrabartia sp.]|nr:hypothetical protein [Chakrabartia sp.]